MSTNTTGLTGYNTHICIVQLYTNGGVNNDFRRKIC